MLAWEGSDQGQGRWSALPTKIVPGERIGDVVLGMTEAQVRACLGAPCETSGFTADDRLDMIKAFAILNQTLGCAYTEKHLLPLSTWLSYDRLGLEVKLEKGRVSLINAYTGVLHGYEDRVRNFFQASHIPSGAAALQTLTDVEAKFGQPDHTYSLTYAPIPSRSLTYSQPVVDLPSAVNPKE